MKLLYITSSSYSGSTLLAFLLNTHPEISTVSEMEGWAYGENKEFLCSCEAPLPECPFFQHIAKAFHDQGLPFSYRNFGTAYRIASSERLNRWLTERLPYSTSTMEKWRDKVVQLVPSFSRQLLQHDQANEVFLRAALDYSKAKVFVDCSKNPFRLRLLRRVPELDINVLYLVRDYRGVTLSNMRNRGCNLRTAIHLWIREQRDILRICEEFPRFHVVYYEDLCDAVDDTLSGIHRFLNLQTKTFPGSFKAEEHHILGNTMRLAEKAEIHKNESWRQALTQEQLELIERELDSALTLLHAPSLKRLIAPYRQ